MTARYDVVIVGCGHAGAQTAIALRQSGFDGSIAMIGEEPHLPYERPPLSKEYLCGTRTLDQMLIRPPQFWSEQSIVMLLGQRVSWIDPVLRHVGRPGAQDIGYGKLVWAAGGSARRLGCAGDEVSGVHTLRSLGDARKLRAEIPNARRAVVVGGGYIGLEATAALRECGTDVVLLEASNRLLARVAGAEISRFYEREHKSRGVDVRLDACVTSIGERDGRVSHVLMAGGERIDCDLVIVGIGIVPQVAPLLEAGAVGGNGVAVDAQCQTSLTHVFAVGDCALHENRYAGAQVRIESVQNATDQATVVAKTILGHEVAYDALPWFWSNQYDLVLQTVGISSGYDRAILRGSPASRSFTVVYLKDGRAIAMDCVNATKDYVGGRLMVAKGVSPDPAMLARTEIPLREMLVA